MNKVQHNEASISNLAEKLKKSLSALSDLSKSLQKAIIKRDVNTIWQLLAEQENKVREFDHYLYLWKEVTSGNPENMSPAMKKMKEDINMEIYSLKATGNSTATLVKSFLAAIGKAIRKTTNTIAKKTNVYSNNGKMKMKQSSLLVNSIG